MKKMFRNFNLLMVSFIFLLSNCGNDDDGTTVVITLENLEVTIDENPTNGQSIGIIQSSGAAELTFSIASQTPSGALTIDASSGELSVADASLFDFETNPAIVASIAAEGASNTATVTITINNINELSVVDFSATIDENPTDGQVLGTVQASGESALTFTISSQTPSGALAIDSSTGALSVVDPIVFDFETNPIITANILVDDGTVTAIATATINLNDVDEVTAQNTNLTIDENPSNGDVIGTLQASGSNLTYTITFQNPAGAFAINPSSGELSVADQTLFDFETNPDMLATVSVSNGIQTVSANAFVSLNDVNEIGEFKFGGVIFWIDPASNNSEGLVCTVNDINNGSYVPWASSFLNTGATGSVIGSGQTNTTAIINSHGTSTYAASLCDSLTLNGYSDWFLPSDLELNEMYLNQTIINTTSSANGGTDFLQVSYWSSTEVTTTNNDEANNVNFNTGNLFAIPKTIQLPVRAVRTWTDF